MAAGIGDDARLRQALFAPRSVALVGASGDAAKNTARPQRYLRKHGFQGKIYPINPARAEVLGEKAYPSLLQAPEGIDHAFIMIEEVEQALAECGKHGIPVASVYSDGFADAGPEGALRQARLVERAKALGVRLLGPNSMGVVDIPGGLALTVNAVLEMDAPLPAGSTSIVSQSGTMLGAVLSRGAARGLGLAKMVSVGNEADLGVGEIVSMLVDDPQTRVILLFLETVRDAARLAAAARQAHGAGKPVVAYKLGRSRLGEALAQSHTGALAGSDAALDAYFRHCGILRVDMLETLIEIAPLVAGRKPPGLDRPARIAVVTTTGGGAASVVDRLGTLGVECVAPDSQSPIVDLTMAATKHSYRETLEALLAWPGCDGVLAVVGSSAQFHPQLAVEPILQCRNGAKPLAAFFTPHAERSLALLAAERIPAFRTPEACADAWAAFFRWRAPASTENQGQTTISAGQEGFSLLRELGIPVARSAVARHPGYEHDLAYPIAVKMLGVDHKTEQGGVVLNVSSPDEVLRIAAGWGAAEILVQEMHSGLAEAIVGYRDDPSVGPIVLVGAGGRLAEIYADVCVELAPVSEAQAGRMIEQVRGLATIRGFRNLPRGDGRALAQVVSALSRLCALDKRPVAEAEINPVIVKANGVVAVDVLVKLKRSGSDPELEKIGV